MEDPLLRDGNNRLLAGLIVVSLFLHGLLILFLADVYRPQRSSYIELTMEEIPRPVSRDLPTPPMRKAVKQPPAMPPKKIKPQLEPVVRPRPDFETMQPPIVSAAPLVQTAIPPLPEIVAAQEVRKTKPDATTPVVEQRLVPAASAETRPIPDDQLVGKYLAGIRARIERYKRYPLAARRRGQEGEVGLRFILAANGEVMKLEVRKSSGIDSLDRAAINAVRRATPFAKPPVGFVDSTLPMELTIVFKLG